RAPGRASSTPGRTGMHRPTRRAVRARARDGRARARCRGAADQTRERPTVMALVDSCQHGSRLRDLRALWKITRLSAPECSPAELALVVRRLERLGARQILELLIEA